MSGRLDSEQRAADGDERLAQLRAENAQLRMRLAGLQQHVRELRWLRLDGGSIYKPPSSVALAKPFRRQMFDLPPLEVTEHRPMSAAVVARATCGRRKRRTQVEAGDTVSGTSPR